MKTPRIRAVLIEDSPFMQRVIGDIITSDDSIALVGVAANGQQGLQLVHQLHPDVVVTDMIMPEYDGLYVVQQVMEQKPTPIILLSSLDKSNHRIFEALETGAFEFIDKPTGLDSISIQNFPLPELIKHAASSDICTLLPQRSREKRQNLVLHDDKLKHEVIIIGASTGGPSAIESIVTSLPPNLSVPVVIAQHMPARFLETFAQRLNDQRMIPVKIAVKGEILQPGTVYILSGEANTRIERSSINQQPLFNYTKERFAEFNLPSINCIMESAADVYGKKALGVILTGMGKDGMRGLKKIKQAGGYTIAQDETSSVVYGMPKAALEYEAVKKVASLSDIPECIIQNL